MIGWLRSEPRRKAWMGRLDGETRADAHEDASGVAQLAARRCRQLASAPCRPRGSQPGRRPAPSRPEKWRMISAPSSKRPEPSTPTTLTSTPSVKNRPSTAERRPQGVTTFAAQAPVAVTAPFTPRCSRLLVPVAVKTTFSGDGRRRAPPRPRRLRSRRSHPPVAVDPARVSRVPAGNGRPRPERRSAARRGCDVIEACLCSRAGPRDPGDAVVAAAVGAARLSKCGDVRRAPASIPRIMPRSRAHTTCG